MIQNSVIHQVLMERARQDAKLGVLDSDDYTWLAALVEEVGEVSQAILHDSFGGHAAGTLQVELIQVAAVAVAWLECLERRSERAQTKERGT